jgi:hypothetical protein
MKLVEENIWYDPSTEDDTQRLVRLNRDPQDDDPPHLSLQLIERAFYSSMRSCTRYL